MRTLPFVLDGADPWDPDPQRGGWLVVRGRATRDQVLELPRAEPYASRNPRVWDRDRCDFVPLD